MISRASFLPLWILAPGPFLGAAFGAVKFQTVLIGEPVPTSSVPGASAQGRFLAPQATSCVDVSSDGKFVAVAFTGDLGFENQDILHRCWGDADKARRVVRVIRDRLLPWRPDVVFTGHGVRPNAMEFLTDLIRHTEASLAQLGAPKGSE